MIPALFRRYWLIGLVAAFGLVASLAMCRFARVSAEEKFASELTLQAENRTKGLQEVLSRYEGTIEGFAATFPFAGIDNDQLQDYARAVFVASNMLRSGLQSVAWAPRVLDGERDGFELSARRAGLAEFRMLDLVSRGMLRPAAHRPEYYILRYSAPETNAPLGLDLLSDPAREAAIRRAIAKGSAAATAPFPFRSGGWGTVLYVPVFKSAAPHRAANKGDDAPLGVLAFRLAISATIDAIVEALEPVPQGLDMYVLDDGAPAGQRVIYTHLTAQTAGGAAPRDEAEVLVEPYFGSSFAFAGRDWTLIVRPSPALRAEASAQAGWYELGGGLAATLLLTVYLVTSRHRAERLRRLAGELQQEVVERRNAEEQLRLTQIAMDRSSEAICLVDRTGRFVHVNDAACALLGYSRAELAALTVADLDPEGGGAARWPQLRETGTQGIATHYHAKNGRVIPIDLTVSKFEFNGRAFHLLVARDATLKRQAEQDLRHAKDEAEKANRAKSEFLANMSHELRTPLNAVIGFSDVMCSQLFGPLGNHRYLEYAQDIRDSGAHLLSLISEILDYSRAEAGKMTMKEEAVDLAEIIRSARRLLEGGIEAHRLALETALPDPVPPLRADPRLLKQMLINLLSNAVKFTPEGGRIRIAVERGAKGELLIRVADTGIGMAPEQIPLAMTPFRQIESALSRKHGGTGLGLPLVRSLIELHGGTIEIASRPGEGTTVTLTLPAARVIDAGAATAEPWPAPRALAG